MSVNERSIAYAGNSANEANLTQPGPPDASPAKRAVHSNLPPGSEVRDKKDGRINLVSRSAILKTARLAGRPITFLDFGRLRSIHADPRVAVTLSANGLPFSNLHTRQAVRSWTQHWEDHGFGVWLFHKPDGEFVGYAGAMHTSIDGKPEVELLYAIRAEFWKDGYATEMATAIVRFAFGTAGLRELVAFTLPTNLGSRRVMEKCGFRYEGDIEHARLPHVLYRLTKD